MIQEMTGPTQGALKLERKFDTIANHLANSATTGFKADILTFDNMLRSRMTTDFTPGNPFETGNPLDFAIESDGFFRIQTANGIRYTRAGNFTLDAQGQLVTQQGDPVLGDGGPLLLDGAQIEVTPEGLVEVDGAPAGRLAVVTFEDKTLLRKEGNSQFVYTGEEGNEIEPEVISVNQGALEQSNVSVVAEMTRMIEINRAYESMQKMLQSIDEANQKVISEVARV